MLHLFSFMCKSPRRSYNLGPTLPYQSDVHKIIESLKLNHLCKTDLRCKRKLFFNPIYRNLKQKQKAGENRNPNTAITSFKKSIYKTQNIGNVNDTY